MGPNMPYSLYICGISYFLKMSWYINILYKINYLKDSLNWRPHQFHFKKHLLNWKFSFQFLIFYLLLPYLIYLIMKLYLLNLYKIIKINFYKNQFFISVSILNQCVSILEHWVSILSLLIIIFVQNFLLVL